MNALRNGFEPPERKSLMDRFVTAAGYDADVFRALYEIVLCLTLPQEVLARPGIKDKVDRVEKGAAGRMPGPDRHQLLRLLSA